MLVRFKNKAYLDKLYKPLRYGQEVPEEYRDRLPASAKIITEVEDVVAAIPVKPVALSELNRKKNVTKSESRTFSEKNKEDESDLDDL